jgi:pyruvate ferredoxin oxidoreductase alpha subunit
MATRVGKEISIALSEIVAMCDVDVVSAYPITPQTHIVEHLAELVANGECNAEYIPVESEHSAMAACLGASATGARTFTATAGQGLELMHEVLYVVSSMRLPVVMAVTNRALSSPLSVWGDHSDVMSVRDTGWIQIFTENGQEVLDNIICAYRIAEDHRVLAPVMIHLDGFNLSHVIEPMEYPDQELINEFLPRNNYPLPLDPKKPVAMGDFAGPVVYTEIKAAQEYALCQSKDVILEIWDEYAKKCGRSYKPVETYYGDAKTLIFCVGGFSETAMTAVDKMRAGGKDIGLVRIRLWRPFPFTELRAALKDTEKLITIDRALSFGGPGGPIASEIKAALYNEAKRPKVAGFIAGLGGRDITVKDYEAIVARGEAIIANGSEVEYELYGVRE